MSGAAAAAGAGLVPGLAEFRALAAGGRLVPVCRRLLADELTPVAAFRRVDDGRHAFLLESLGGGERRGRHSLVGSRPACVFVLRGDRAEVRTGDGVRPCAGDPLGELRALLARHRAVALPGLPAGGGTAVVHLARRRGRWHDPLGGLPGIVVLFAGVVDVFDHVAQTLQVVTHARGGDDPDAAYAAAAARLEAELERLRTPVPPAAAAPPAGIPAVDGTPRAEFLAAAGRARDLVRSGERLRATVALAASAPVTRPALETYRALRAACPSSGLYLLRVGEAVVMGSAPATLLRRDGDLLEARPTSGAWPRGRDAAEDARLADELRADAAECAAHALLADLAASDVGALSQPGTVEVRDVPAVERGAHTLRLVTAVRGRARAGLDPLAALSACFPPGELAGVPRPAAAPAGDAPEGFLAGLVGHLDHAGDFELRPAARAIACAGGRAHWGGIAAVAADGEAEAAWQRAAGEAHRLEQVVLAAERGLP